MAFINQHEHLTKSNFKINSTTKSTNDKMKETNNYIFFANSSITLDWNHCCSHSNKRLYY